MSIQVTTEIFCDRCTNQIPRVVVSDRRQIRAARHYVARAGWVTKYEDGQLVDICTKCQNDEEKPDWRRAIGAIPWQEGDESAEARIRRLRDG